MAGATKFQTGTIQKLKGNTIEKYKGSIKNRAQILEYLKDVIGGN